VWQLSINKAWRNATLNILEKQPQVYELQVFYVVAKKWEPHSLSCSWVHCFTQQVANYKKDEGHYGPTSSITTVLGATIREWNCFLLIHSHLSWKMLQCAMWYMFIPASVCWLNFWCCTYIIYVRSGHTGSAHKLLDVIQIWNCFTFHW